MIDPYDFIRLTTLFLAAIWTARGLWRTWRFLRRWEGRLHDWGIERTWLRRMVVRMLARATVLDPVNLALMILLVSSWVVRVG
ncbi:MAG: hypothetical protein O7B99_07355 [Planctomycetota bacterium]|nr:hypothetical protein [Planctomycetota bacterium]